MSEVMAVPLSGKKSLGRSALISACDYERVTDRGPWYLMNDQGHIGRNETAPYGGKMCLYLHRFILDAPPHMQVDHIDGNTFDCTRPNLRLATPQQNAQNKRATGEIPFKGVNWCGSPPKYESVIWLNRKRVLLGYFDDLQGAALAYDRAAIEHFGIFARTNFAPGTQYDPLNPVFDHPSVFRLPIKDNRHTSELLVLFARKLRAAGMPYRDIGVRLGLTESGAHRLVNSRHLHIAA